jgi:hypothetical protein
MLAMMLLTALLGGVMLTASPRRGNRRVCLTDGNLRGAHPLSEIAVGLRGRRAARCRRSSVEVVGKFDAEALYRRVQNVSDRLKALAPPQLRLAALSSAAEY